MGCAGSKAPTKEISIGSKAKFQVAIIGLSPDVSGSEDKDAKGRRYDSVPISNGIVQAGVACDLIDYTPSDHDGFLQKVMGYDGVIIRFVPDRHLGPNGTKLFNNALDTLSIKGKAVWSSPVVRETMGAKDALVKIKDLRCGLPDTFCYFDKKSFDAGVKKSLAFSPRVVKQNRGRSGEGVWLVWLESKRYCETFGEKSLTDRDRLKLMEMSDNHVEFHTVKEFVSFCCDGPGGEDAGQMWASSYPGKYFEGGRSQGGIVVDQRLLPRIVEGEVRLLMSGDSLLQIIHKKPHAGEMSAVDQQHAVYTSYDPGEYLQFGSLRETFESELENVFAALGIGGEPLPLLWTADFIPVDDHKAEYVIGEFNCSCVSLDMFQRAIGSDLKAVPKADLNAGYRLANLIGLKVLEQLEEIKGSGGFTSVGKTAQKPVRTSSFRAAPKDTGLQLRGETTPLPARPKN